jgi:uncharacterized protein YggT (Ycf19 family)
MILLAHTLNVVAMVLGGFAWLYKWILIARAITSWVSASPRNPIVSFLYMVTEPPIRAVRRWLPTNLRYFPLDIAFLALFALVILVEYGIAPALADYGALLRSRAMAQPF